MHYLKSLNLDNPRQNAVEAMKRTVSAQVWKQNSEFTDSLRHEIEAHPITQHPMIRIFESGEIPKDVLQVIHLEYRHAIVQIFIDALLAAQLETRQLEPRLPYGSKVPPRFLLTLNNLDEFGFRPGLDSKNYFRGNPLAAHYPLFETVLDDLGTTDAEREAFNPSEISDKLRRSLLKTFGDLLQLTTLLAVVERQVILFSPSMRKASGAVGLNVDDGYYFVHGISEDETAEASDDDHEDDLWNVLNQALEAVDYDGVRNIAISYCDLWAEFWDHQYSIVKGFITTHSLETANEGVGE